ncbi:MAG: RNA-binding protein [Proteobacteria bacterium]|nr:RNA-binding protein [Pseudomonadota bacterium]
MPKGPRGEKRPADVIGAAVMVGRIATGEIEEGIDPKREARSKGGKRGGAARTMVLTPEQRSEIARAAAAARWQKT